MDAYVIGRCWLVLPQGLIEAQLGTKSYARFDKVELSKRMVK